MQPTTVKYYQISGSVGLTQELVALDVNNDGKLDLVGASLFWPPQDNSIPVYVLLNNGKGSFTLGSNLISGGVPGTTHPREMLTGDFNSDGITDIFIADHGYDANPYPGYRNTLLLGKAGGGFVNATGVANLPGYSDFTHSAAAVDIDGDGDLDIYVGNVFGGNTGPYFLINDGSAHFTVSTAGLPADIVARTKTYTTSLFIDVDGDGDKDLYLGADSAGDKLLINDGSGHFTSSATSLPDGLFGAANSIRVDSQAFDFNRDGKLDILSVQTSNGPFYVGARLQILQSNGAGGFTDASSLYLDSQPNIAGWIKYITFADINKDGALDMVGELSGNTQGIVAYINDGTNHFYQLPKDALYAPGGTFEVMDINGDKVPEIVQVGNSDGKYQLAVISMKIDSGDVTGTSKADTIFGGSKAQTLWGKGGKDVLVGGGGNDVLVGGAAGDKLLGGKGSDTASYVDATKAVTANLANTAKNTGDAKGDVYASIENLAGSKYSDVLTGDAAGNMLSGGDGNDKLYGGGGNDKLYGGLGKDTLIGGLGKDTFVFDTKLGAANVDKIADFVVKDDTIWLDDDIFTKVGRTGHLAKDAFWIGTKAHDASDRIIYDNKSGKLWYDADGNGKEAAVLFATIDKHLKMTFADFDIIA